jgi:hypothetical protein
MASHRQLRSTVDGLAAVAIGAALMAGAPIGAASAVGGDGVGSAGGDASGDPTKLRAAAAARRPRPAA